MPHHSISHSHSRIALNLSTSSLSSATRWTRSSTCSHLTHTQSLCLLQMAARGSDAPCTQSSELVSWWLPQVGSIMKKHSPACPILCSAAERLAREYCMEHCVGMLHRVGKRAHCHIWGFYPPEVTVIWLHNGDIVEPDDYNPISAIPNGDWSYQMQVSVLVAPVAGDTYTCSVQHVSLQEPLLEDWSEWRGAGPQPEAGCLGSLLPLTSLFLYKPKRK
uniref:Ig-like domain-containing protein n=1 Tax=Anas platyrhynchos platyrhynchos TaxID=8840 RepID=A0A493U1T3_ANAPP